MITLKSILNLFVSQEVLLQRLLGLNFKLPNNKQLRSIRIEDFSCEEIPQKSYKVVLWYWRCEISIICSPEKLEEILSWCKINNINVFCKR